MAPQEKEVNPDERRDRRRQKPDVEGEEARESSRPNSVPADEEVGHVRSHERRVGADLYPYDAGPESVLVPPEQIPGEREPYDEQEEDHADDPVDLPRGLVRAREEGAGHVQPDHRHQE